MTIRWEDILSYEFSFSTTNVTYLTISLNDGSTKRFSFKDEKDQIHSVNELSIFSLFFYYISQFNQANESVKKIIMKPGFLTGKRGGFVICGLVILDVIAITIHFILNPGTVMFSLMSTFIILGLIVKRKTDTAFYNKMMQSVPRAPLFDQR